MTLEINVSLPESMKLSGAIFDVTRTWRYYLWRRWDMWKPPLICVMLNPSVADEVDSDHTVTKMVEFAKQLDCGGLDVYNIFALCSTYPKVLYSHADPIGPENNTWLCTIASDAQVVCAWGRHGEFRGRGYSVTSSLKERRCKTVCFGRCSNGEPRHPLMISYETQLVPFSY